MAITTQPGAKGSDLTTLLGTELADTFAITANDLFIDGLEGADTVTAAGAIDDLTAEMGDGNDNLTFSGDLTDSEIDFGDGNDTAQFENYDNGELIGGTGTDSFDFNRAVEESTIKGGTGDDDFTFDTTLDDSLIWGNSDDDTITVVGATTKSTIYGGKQEDVIEVAGATDTKLRGDNDDDTITVVGPLDNVVVQGNADDDQINITAITAVKTTIFGGKGDDDININDTGGDDGAMLVRGDDGADDIDITGDAAYTVSGGAGDDNIDSQSTVAGKYFGGKGDDTIIIDFAVTKSGTQNYASGDEGDDSIDGSTGADSIDGGTGDDTINTAGGDDTVYGKAGDDSITLGDGDVNALGGADDDTIAISVVNLDSDDDIRGETGDDVLRLLGDGDDLEDVDFTTVTGIETVIISAMTRGQEAVLGAKAQATGIRTITSEVVGEGGADSIINASTFTSAAALTLNASDEDVDEAFIGGAGNDTFNSGADGEVAMTGGAGVDLFNFTSEEIGSITDLSGTDNFTLDAGSGEIAITVTADYTASAATKNLTDSAANADVAGSGFDVSFAAVTTGTSGFDIAGDDTTASTLIGSGLADLITGGNSAESIVGGAGDDTLIGDAGADTINALTGEDVIDFNALTDGGAVGDTDVFAAGDTINNVVVAGAAGAVELFDFDGVAGLENPGVFESVASGAMTGTAGVALINNATAASLTDTSDVLTAIGDISDQAGGFAADDVHFIIVGNTAGDAFGIYGLTDDGNATVVEGDLNLMAVVNTAVTGFDGDNVV